MDGDEETKKKLLDSKEKMFEGESFSKVIKETQIYSPLHARMIMIAERTGETDQALSKIAVQVDEEVTAEIQNFVSVIEPTSPARDRAPIRLRPQATYPQRLPAP